MEFFFEAHACFHDRAFWRSSIKRRERTASQYDDGGIRNCVKPLTEESCCTKHSTAASAKSLAKPEQINQV
jgi:hypothetical protein